MGILYPRLQPTPPVSQNKNQLALLTDFPFIYFHSLAAENEATHLKQLKKYILQFIKRAEHRNSSSSEITKPDRKMKMKIKDTSSTDGSEVKVEAKKIIEIVSNPLRKIASDMTINIAKTLTDVLVQESSTKSPKNISTSTKFHKDTENETEENSLPYCTTMGSGKSLYEWIKLVFVEVQESNFYTIFTYGFVFTCGALYIIKKCK